MEEGVRIDKWLWAVRIFKTRSQATTACRAGKVKISDGAVKPSRIVKIGELITVSQPPVLKTLKPIALIENRVSAKLAVEYVEDLTPKEEYDKARGLHEPSFEFRPRGTGRPTKRERRTIENLKKYLGD
jgi:ribosome-associated heat shock protein Hsp15